MENDALMKEMEQDLLGDVYDVSNDQMIDTPDDVSKNTVEPTPPASKALFEKMGWEVPEDIDFTNEDEAIQKVKEFNTKKEPEDDFIREYKERKEKEQINPEDFIKEKMERLSIKNLPADEGLRKYLSQIKEDDGNPLYSEEDIDEFLNSKPKIEKDQMWREIKKNITQEQPKQESNNIDLQQYSREYNSKQVPKLLTYATSELKEKNDIYGIPYGETERKEFDKQFSDLMSIDATGESMVVYPKPILKILNNPSELYKLMYLKTKLESGSFDIIPKSKQTQVEEDALSKMGVSRKQVSGEYRATSPPPTSDDFI